MEVKVIGQMDNTIDHTFESANRVYDVGGVSPTINTCGGGGLQPKILEDAQAIRMVRTEEGKALRKDYESGAIHHGFNEHREMQLRTDGVSNTLTSVQKDNLVMEKVIIDDTYANRKPRLYEDYSPALRSEREGLKTIETISTKGKQIEVASTILAGYERTNMTGFNADNGVVETVRIKQATSQGYIECEVGGVADLSFPESKTRRGRVQEKGQVSPTLMAGEQDICRIEPQLVGGIGEKWGGKQYRQGNRVYDSESVAMAVTSQPLGNMGGNSYMYLTREPQYRIRKLTPRECWRLMDFTDEDFEKAAQVNSNTQLYKQAGNSIVKNVLVAIIGQMLPGKENIYKEN